MTRKHLFVAFLFSTALACDDRHPAPSVIPSGPDLAPSPGIPDCSQIDCETPPPDTCDGDTAVQYNPIGVCVPTDGSCRYRVSRQDCYYGYCEGARCHPSCEGLDCNTTPPPDCADANHLRTYSSGGGGCVTDRPCGGGKGRCEFPSRNTWCDFGCVAGACVTQACVNGQCSQAPTRCIDAQTLFSCDIGSCSNNQCSYFCENTGCPNGCSQGKCQ
jgi:hypothetical protein